MNEQYVLYQYDACPFCRRVRAFLDRSGIEMPMRDTMRDVAAFRELCIGGGRSTVPCLKITGPDGESTWLYESNDIIEYLSRVDA
ncbi:MAG: glutathione S-transferase N-terminal domain-containing protein [Gammaproteobacteria bacterium]|nr:glutathione S-transferase N-terminal domain-containing protein [Gammaproteobacteria bacterium]